MKLPEIDIKEIEKQIEDNKRERIEFIRQYAKWVKNNPDKVWSAQQKKLFSIKKEK